MSRKIKIDNLSSAIANELKEFAKIETDEMKKAIKETGKETVKELQQTSPKNKGSYAKHWSSKTTYENTKEIRVSVYEKKPEYRKIHLLEKGHAKRNGGRVAGIPHVRPAEEKAIRKIEERIKKRL